METKRGNLSINSDNIFPIIKKWMYSDQDIFIRELISNGCDAITKRKKLDAVGEAKLPEGYKPKIDVLVNDKEKTLKFIDNGVGMTAEEVVKDITDIAFSGATEFLEKYKDKADQDQIIGHFGLGFYSAFMVADQVDIDTLSFQEGAEPVHWECDGSTEYAMGTGDRKEVGTTITLHLNEDCLEYANEYKVRVNYSTYPSNEDMYTKLMTGAAYDVLFPSDYMVQRLIRENKLQPLDRSVVTNLDNLSDRVKNLYYDPDNTYSVPYLWQSVGILFDTTKIDPADMEEQGWLAFQNPDYAGHVYAYDSEREGFLMGLKTLGLSVNTTSEADLEAAYNWLREMDKTVRPSYVNRRSH